MTKKIIKVGSRDSQLALWQTKYAIEQLKPVFEGYEFEIVDMKTKGDKILDVSLSKIGDKGLFTNELESLMLSGEIDMAVHSLKDMPTSLPEELGLTCFLKRYDCRDALLTKHPGGIMELPEGAIVGTSSLRRRAQLLALRPDLQIRDLRGNVNTRLRKYHEGDFDAVILAVAGLERLNLGNEISEHLDEKVFIPAVGQGALVIESRKDREDLLSRFAQVNDEETVRCVTAERQFMCALDGGCQVPMGAIAKINDKMITIHGFVGSIDGTKILKAEVIDVIDHYDQIGKILAEKLLIEGAREILEDIRRS